MRQYELKTTSLEEKEKAFIKLIDDNERLIYKVASVYTDTYQDREDLIQEIVYQLWKSYDSFESRSKINTWLYRVSMNVAIFHLKRVKKKKIHTSPLNEEVAQTHLTETENKDHKWQEVTKHIKNLNLLEKGVIMLYLEGKSYEEISSIVGISVTNVGTKLSRIKAKLKQQINKSNGNR